jgi:EAL domain-containing protein (putative c-di-GMP-specific phosphodiesterase class I)
MDRLLMVEDLRRAIAESRIDVVYQPIVASETGLITGAEALARWQRDGQPVPPDVFIGLAEETGLISSLGSLVLRKVQADAARLRQEVRGPLTLGVNVSAQELRDPTYAERVRAAFAGMGGAGLVLEITERQGIEFEDAVLSTMHEIAAMGVAFAIDDFGVGFSSVSYLQRLPVQVVKADGSLARTIDSDKRASALLRSVMTMGRSLGVDVVVEGIERESQLAQLKKGEGVYVQGYLLHRPMPFDALVRVLQDERGCSAA